MNQSLRRDKPGGHSGSPSPDYDKAPPAYPMPPKGATDIPQTEFDDKRAHPRDPAQDLSEIILDGRTYGIACLIHDISASGARLEVSCGELPKRFILANYTKRTKTLCRQVWREKRLVGVKFLTSPRPFALEERL